MTDFTIRSYVKLLEALVDRGFAATTVSQYHKHPEQGTIVLRHDVDRKPCHSLTFARILAGKGLKGTFYFRIRKGSFDETIVRQIESMGHEIGYHYEEMTTLDGWRRNRIKVEELIRIAMERFTGNLIQLRKLCNVDTICMHGSPMSRWDSRLLWKYYDYKAFGIKCEPYFDIDFSNTLYLTDTGRRWDGSSYSIRDKFVSQPDGQIKACVNPSLNNSKDTDYYSDWKAKPKAGSLMYMSPDGLRFQNRYNYRSTSQITNSIISGTFPLNAMMTFHPQRWTDKRLLWLKELVSQNVKNQGKLIYLRIMRKVYYM